MVDTPKKAHLIVSDDSEPKLQLKPGMRFEVHSVSVVDEQLVASNSRCRRVRCAAPYSAGTDFIRRIECKS